VGLERGPLSLVNNLRSYLEEIVAAPGLDVVVDSSDYLFYLFIYLFVTNSNMFSAAQCMQS
jgi:hypothetical protein